MNIGFISRATLYTSPGGDTIQMEMMAKFLRAKGQRVDVLTTNLAIRYEDYDLLHFFNLTRPADILPHMTQAKCPVFVTPIYLDLQEYERKNPSHGPLHWISKLLPPGQVEYLKCIARYLKNGERINSTYYLFRGHNQSIQKVLRHCSGLMPNSASELKRIQNTFRYSGPQTVIPCGIDPAIFGSSEKIEKEEELVLSVGRIERRKNQLSLIRALNNSAYKLIIVGNPSPNHQHYYDECRKEAASNIQFVENITQTELVGYYSRARVHALPSWFETAGLSSLEAAACGCNIVVSDKGDVRDYFKDRVWYCDPGNEEDIFRAVDDAMKAPLTKDLQEHVRNHLSWEEISEQTLKYYMKHLSI